MKHCLTRVLIALYVGSMTAAFKQVRVCARCKVAKPVNEFGVDRSRLLRLNVYCLDCVKARDRQRRANETEAARTKRLERMRQHYEQNKDAYKARVKQSRKRKKSRNVDEGDKGYGVTPTSLPTGGIKNFSENFNKKLNKA